MQKQFHVLFVLFIYLPQRWNHPNQTTKTSANILDTEIQSSRILDSVSMVPMASGLKNLGSEWLETSRRGVGGRVRGLPPKCSWALAQWLQDKSCSLRLGPGAVSSCCSCSSASWCCCCWRCCCCCCGCGCCCCCCLLLLLLLLFFLVGCWLIAASYWL